MHPARFVYLQAANPAQASALLRRYKDEAKILAGGQSLIPMMKLRLMTPKYVVDISEMTALSYIRQTAKTIRIGALTKQTEIEYSPLITKKLPILVEAARQIADQQVRNLGTLGGAICHADPAGDWSANMIATDAEFEVRGSKTRRVRAKEFFKGPFETVLKPDEILTEIAIPIPKGNKVGQAYVKFERRTGDFATVGVAASLALGRRNEVKDVGLAVCAASPAPFAVNLAKEIMRGKVPNLHLIEEVAAEAAKQSEPTSDLRGPAEYKREMVGVFTRRALGLALSRAGYNLGA